MSLPLPTVPFTLAFQLQCWHLSHLQLYNTVVLQFPSASLLCLVQIRQQRCSALRGTDQDSFLRVLSKMSEHQLCFLGKKRPINKVELWIERNKLPAYMFPWSQQWLRPIWSPRDTLSIFLPTRRGTPTTEIPGNFAAAYWFLSMLWELVATCSPSEQGGKGLLCSGSVVALVFLVVFSTAESYSYYLIKVLHSEPSWLMLAPSLTCFFSTYRLMHHVE